MKNHYKTFPELHAHSQLHISRHCVPRGPVCAVPSSSARYSCHVFITARRRPDVAVPSNTRTCACPCRRHCMHGSITLLDFVHDLCLAPTDMPLWAGRNTQRTSVDVVYIGSSLLSLHALFYWLTEHNGSLLVCMHWGCMRAHTLLINIITM